MNTDAVDTILADFRAWLLEARETPAPEPADHLDVATVVQHFTALRQEINLQTKSSRSALEQNASALALLQQALDSIQRQPASDKNASDELLRPLLKTLVDAHDALSLAQREVQRLLATASTGSAPTPAESPPSIRIQLPYWTRWFGLDTSVEAQLAPLRAWVARQTQSTAVPPTDAAASRQRQALDALLVGYAMSLQRIERALVQHGLEAITCVGQPFDPETMEVAEVVREEGRTGTEVLQEVRRGYRWRGRLFRYAQVRVAKP